MSQLYSAGRQLIGSEVGEDCSDDRILEDIQVVAFVSLDSIRFIFDPKNNFKILENRKFPPEVISKSAYSRAC